MAQWIDRTALWLLLIISAMFFTMIITNGSIVAAIVLSFVIIIAIRVLLNRLPNGRWLYRSEKIRRINALLRKWTLMDSSDALNEIKRYLPELTAHHDIQSETILVQRLPEEEALSSNQLLGLWKSHSGQERLIVLTTCRANDHAHALANELSNPFIVLIDKELLTRSLLHIISLIPNLDTKKERRASFHIRIAHRIRKLHPFHAGLYAASLFGVYLITNSVFYLIGSIALCAAIALHFLLNSSRRTHLL